VLTNRTLRYVKIALRRLVAGDFEVIWKRPEPNDLVIWDEVGASFLLEEIAATSYYILKVRDATIYLHPLIVWRTLIDA
jgi:hypothetical protein